MRWFDGWSGLWSAPGPRYLFVATPLLLLSLGPWFDGGISARARLCVATLAVIGALVQLSLLIASWTYVMHIMDYRKWAPKMEFMFVPDQSPILASASSVLAGICDPWLCRLYEGWDGFGGQPLAVVVVLFVFVGLLFTLVTIQTVAGWLAG